MYTCPVLALIISGILYFVLLGPSGGGKTTLLDAVQLVLYGPRARCSKRRDQPYEQFLRESIHHGADPAEGAAIELSFRHASQGEEHLYEVTRSWSEVRGRMRDRVWVYRDGEADGYLSHKKEGRRNHYNLHPDVHLRHPLEHEIEIGQLIEFISNAGASE